MGGCALWGVALGEHGTQDLGRAQAVTVAALILNGDTGLRSISFLV